MSTDLSAPLALVPGRECGTCNICCKLFEGPMPDKRAGQWCVHCAPGKGCLIHVTRPEACRDFYCFWLLAEMLGPEWKPERCRFVLTLDPHTRFMLVQIDPSQPTAWRKEPFYSQFKKWSAAGLNVGRQVIVLNGRDATVILPDKDVHLGVIGQDERIVTTMQPVIGGGFSFNVEKRKTADDAAS